MKLSDITFLMDWHVTTVKDKLTFTAKHTKSSFTICLTWRMVILDKYEIENEIRNVTWMFLLSQSEIHGQLWDSGELD